MSGQKKIKVPGGSATGPVETAASPASQASLAAIGLILLACLCFSGLDATAKYLSQSLPPLQIVWMRFVVHVVLALIIFQVWKTPSLFKTRRPLLQIVRAFCLLATTTGNFLAVQHLQLAETMSIMFAAPFVVTALAGPMLGEWARIRRWAAILVGFIGVLIVTQPGSGEMHWAAIYAVAALFFYALYALLTRKLAATDSSASMLLISAAVAAIAMTPAGFSVWVTPSNWFDWGLLLSTGVYGCVGHLIFIQAHRLAPAPVLAPFIYVQIIWMVTLGYFVFNDVPTVSTIIGASIVVASGLYILYREQLKAS